MNRIFLFLFLISSFAYCEDESNNKIAENKDDKNNYVLKIIPIDKVEIITIGKKYYTLYRSYENSINREVTNYTVPEDLREYISFKLVIKKKPLIKYTYKYNFDGINIDYKFFKLDKAFQFFSYLIY